MRRWTFLALLLLLGAPARAQEGSKADDIDKLLEQAEKAPGPPKPGEVAKDDKDIDSLLGEIGKTADKPDAADAPKGQGPAPAGPAEPGAKADGLDGKTKEIDDHLEEMVRIRKKKGGNDSGQGQGQGESSGPLADVIKQMREVQKRLDETDTGEKTQEGQQEILKKLEVALEQAKKMGGSGRRMSMSRQNGPMDQPSPTNDPQEGVGLQANQQPKKNGMVAGGKDEWGHLPPELRQEMNNVFKEKMLESRRELIERYYSSLAKKGRATKP